MHKRVVKISQKTIEQLQTDLTFFLHRLGEEQDKGHISLPMFKGLEQDLRAAMERLEHARKRITIQDRQSAKNIIPFSVFKERVLR